MDNNNDNSITFSGPELKELFLEQNRDLLAHQAQVAETNKITSEKDRLDGEITKGRMGILTTGFQVLSGKSPDGMAFLKLLYESAELLSASCKRAALEVPDEGKEAPPGYRSPSTLTRLSERVTGGGPVPGLQKAAGPM